MIRILLVVLAIAAISAGIYFGLRQLLRTAFPSAEADPVAGEKIETASQPLLERRMAKVLLGLALLLFLLLAVHHVLETRQSTLPSDLTRPTLEEARP